MNFELSEEQRMLKDSVDGIVKDGKNVWPRLAEQGFLGVPFTEGFGPQETMLVMEALGKHLVHVPYLSSAVIGGNFLKGTPHADAIAEGKLQVTLAHIGEGTVYRVVPYADTAHKIIVGGKYMVDAKDCEIKAYDAQDGSRAATVKVPDKGEPIKADVQRVLDIATAAVCGEAVGAMEALFTMTVEYLKIRKQFGVPIATFQALQHRAADMMVSLEQARSMAMYAAMMCETDSKAVSAAKVQINDSARHIGQECIQLHGGIGMTWEYKGGHYFKRLAMIISQLGDNDFHLRRLYD